MFSAIKRLFTETASPEEQIALQPPGTVFPWSKLTELTALEELTIGVPSQIISGDEVIGSVIRSHPDTEIRLPTAADQPLILLRLKAGMSVSLTKSCQALVVADDNRPRRIKVSRPKQ